MFCKTQKPLIRVAFVICMFCLWLCQLLVVGIVVKVTLDKDNRCAFVAGA